MHTYISIYVVCMYCMYAYIYVYVLYIYIYYYFLKTVQNAELVAWKCSVK